MPAILANMTQLLRPPRFADEAKTHRASILNAILLSTILFTCCLILFRTVTTGVLWQILNLVLGVFVLITMGLVWLMRSGRVTLASFLMIATGWSVLAFLTWDTGSIQDTSIMAHAVLILGASLLLGWKGTILATAVAMANVWFFYVAMRQGWVTPIERWPSGIALDQTILFALIAVQIYILIRNLTTAVRDARRTSADLTALSATLEQQVAERTQNAEAARREAEAAQQRLEKQIWFATGQTQLSNVMRGEQEINQLAQNIVTFLCRYLELPVGAIYLLNNHYMVLELSGHFSYRPPTDAPTTFRLGEGLVGEAAQQRDPLLLQPAPASLLTVESSLGTAVASHLLLQPLWYEHILLGVMVLGQWQPFTSQQTDFVTAVLNNITIALHTARTRDYINQLLEQEHKA